MRHKLLMRYSTGDGWRGFHALSARHLQPPEVQGCDKTCAVTVKTGRGDDGI